MKCKKILPLLSCFCLLFTACTAPQQSQSAETEPAQAGDITPQMMPDTEAPAPTEGTTEAPAPASVYMSHPETLEVNTNVSAGDFITYSNVTLKDPAMKINTGTLGSFEVVIPYYYGSEVREETISYQVRDTTPPIILNNGEDAFIKTGEEYDLRELIGYGDNYDTNISLTYDGEVDTSVPGKYFVSAHLIDASGNQSTCRFNVVVGETNPNSSSSRDPVKFSSFKQKFAGQEGVTFGVDVSSWQGEVDFKALKKAGCDFVFLRIGKGISGDITEDDYFAENLKAAKAAGLKIGVYFYTTDNSVFQIRADADWVADTLGKEKLDFPVAFDWEDFTNFQRYDINLYELNLIYQSFAAELNQKGYDTMLYSSKFYLENVWQVGKGDKVWLAHYTDKTDYTGNYMMWQRCDTGLIDGIDGNADINVMWEQNYLTESPSEQTPDNYYDPYLYDNFNYNDFTTPAAEPQIPDNQDDADDADDEDAENTQNEEEFEEDTQPYSAPGMPEGYFSPEEWQERY